MQAVHARHTDLIGLPYRWNTWAMIRAWAARPARDDLPALEEGAQLRNEREGAPVVVLVVPGSKPTEPPARSTWAHFNGSTSERLRHPV